MKPPCKVTVTTNSLSIHYRCESCNTGLQNPTKYPTEWIKTHTEDELYTPFINCGHKEEDGTCSHPRNTTPECHQHICPIERSAPVTEKAVAVGQLL